MLAHTARSAHRIAALVVGSVLLALPAGNALAHPHVFIDATATILFDKDRVSGVRMHWEFDELYSSALINDFDRNKNKVLEPEEIAALHDGAFVALESMSYFTHVRIDGHLQKLKGVQDFTASLKRGQMVYEFVAVLQAPVDPNAHHVAIGPYDPSYYVHFDLDPKRSVHFAGMQHAKCSYSLDADPDNPIYFGAILPRNIQLTCGRA